MACFHPVHAWQTEAGEIVFAERGNILRSLTLACGQCVGCRLERSRQWAVRCVHEASCYDANSFVTLTYRSEKLPENGSLRYRDFQLFMKRLRKRAGKARFFMCGEYGAELGRPHYHACLFGVHFNDRVFLRNLPSGHPIYTSKALEELWSDRDGCLGHCSVGDVSFDSAAYVARYVLKKVGNDVERLGVVDFSTGEIAVKREEFVKMSTVPAIGVPWLKKYYKDVYSFDRLIFDGMEMNPPRYYDKWLDENGTDREVIEKEFLRETRQGLIDPLESTVARLAVREKCTRARLDFKKRTLE